MKEQVLVLVKPDGVRKAIAGSILNIFTATDLRLVGIKVVQVSKPLAEAHYRHLKGQFFFKDIVKYLMGGLHDGANCIAMVFEGANAVKLCRKIAGATNPEEADPRSVRGKFGRVTTKGVFENLVHVSSDDEEARREIALWFKKNELLGGTKA
jgi:nucleoside-diphosphate kinase